MSDDDFLESDGYDASIPTPDHAVNWATEDNPNPPPVESGGTTFVPFLDDRPPVDGGHAPGAVNEHGGLLRADGYVAMQKVND